MKRKEQRGSQLGPLQSSQCNRGCANTYLRALPLRELIEKYIRLGLSRPNHEG